MTLLPTMMITITLTTLVIMVPRTFLSWMKAEALTEEGERKLLTALLGEQNSWVKVHFSCGVVGLGMVWTMMNYHETGLPNILTDSVALYVTVTLLLSIVESLVAQKIADRIEGLPLPVRVRSATGRKEMKKGR